MAFMPPVYQYAAYRQLWPTIAPYIQDRDLYVACLVSHQWHSIFAPLLWSSPASRFGTDSDTVYLSLTRFKRLLIRTRLEVRRLAHTLHIPPAETEFYGGPQEGWLRDILDRLPALQSLIVSELSYFDHQSLYYIHHDCQAHTTYPLKLLVASGCQNTTASSLSLALSHFPDLIYLDLSGAQGSRHPDVLRQIGALQNLRVLKMRNCGLKDDDIDHLTFTTKLRSLDLNNNHLTERGVYMLSLLLPMLGPVRRETANSAGSGSPFERRYSGVPLPTRVISQGVDNFVANRLMSSMEGPNSIQEGLPKSFSYLYLASNPVSLDAITRLINRSDLQHLDAGSLTSNRSHNQHSPNSAGSDSGQMFDLPEVELLSPSLFCHEFQNLRSLRLHHSVITSRPFSGKDKVLKETAFELHGEDLRYELDSKPVLKSHDFFELEDTGSSHSPGLRMSPDVTKDKFGNMTDDRETHATFESPDDVAAKLNSTVSMYSRRSCNVGRKPDTAFAKSSFSNNPPPHIFVPTEHRQISNDYIVSRIVSVPEGPARFRYNYAAAPERPWQEALSRPKLILIKDILEEVLQRKHHIEARERHPGRFKPSMLPNLRTLTLTDVPSTTRRRIVTDALTCFIQECAEEEEIARLEQLLQNQQHHQSRKRLLSGPLKLERLTLEVTSQSDPILPTKARNKRLSFTKSSTEDADSETFMSQSETDFFFFSEDDGGLLITEGRIDAPLHYDEGMEVGLGREIDVVSELASWRRERKRRWELLERLGGEEMGVERCLDGHWRGEIGIVRGS